MKVVVSLILGFSFFLVGGEASAVITCLNAIRIVGAKPGVDSHPVGRKVAVLPRELPRVQKSIWLMHHLQRLPATKELSSDEGVLRVALAGLPEILKVRHGQILVSSLNIVWREGEIESISVEFYDESTTLIAGLIFVQDRDPQTKISSIRFQGSSVFEPEGIKKIFQYPARALEILRFQHSSDLGQRLDDEPDLRASVEEMKALVPAWIFRPLLANLDSSIYGDRRIQFQISQRFEGGKAEIQSAAQMLQILPGSKDWETVVGLRRMHPAEAINPTGDVEVLVHEVQLDSFDDEFELLRVENVEPYVKTSELPSQTSLILSDQEEDEETGNLSSWDYFLSVDSKSAREMKGTIYRRRTDAGVPEIGRTRLMFEFTINADGIAHFRIRNEKNEVVARLLVGQHIVDFKSWKMNRSHPAFGFQSEHHDFQSRRGFLARLPEFDRLIEPAIQEMGRLASERFEASRLPGHD